MYTDAIERANQCFADHIQQNPYPGRGLVLGRSSIDDAWLIVYWIMGRSAHSKNRRFVAEGAVLRTEPVDLSLVKDPSLIIYEAMLELPGLYLVSNGDQTRTIYETLRAGGTFDDALATREREPDPPNYTPRISAMLDLRNAQGALTLSLLKAKPGEPRVDRPLHLSPGPAAARPGIWPDDVHGRRLAAAQFCRGSAAPPARGRCPGDPGSLLGGARRGQPGGARRQTHPARRGKRDSRSQPIRVEED